MADNPSPQLGWNGIHHFKPFEFDSPDAPGSGETKMSLEFVKILDQLRELVAKPLYINSGFRTPEHHKKIYNDKDVVPNSAHLRGLAVDIRCLDSHIRYLILNYAFQLKIKRIEVAPRHVHLDIDKTLPQEVVWLVP